jgi:hypothetical protein
MNANELADMNVNKLADDLESASSDMEYNIHVNDWALLFESAVVLRQQQAEIEALTKELETCKTIVALSNIAWERKHGKD